MPVGLLGKKIGMSHIFDTEGNLAGVTLIQAGPCYVVQNKTEEHDGYKAVQIGFGAVRESRLNKPILGYFKKNNIAPLKYVREFRLTKDEKFDIGAQLKIDLFKSGDFVDIIGTTRGKGFAGGVKRYGFKGGKQSRGSMFHRAPGSIGTNTFPGRVLKGKRLPGHMGDSRATSIGLFVAEVDLENNLLAVKGNIPGAPGGLVIIQKSKRNKRIKIKQKVAEDKKVAKKPSKKKE